MTDAERRRNQFEVGERLIARLQPTDPQLAELKFQLAFLRIEEADEWRADAGSENKDALLKASAVLGAILRDHPNYARNDEVALWRADSLSRLEFWSDAETAWRTVTREPEIKRYRLGQVLVQLHR